MSVWGCATCLVETVGILGGLQPREEIRVQQSSMAARQLPVSNRPQM